MSEGKYDHEGKWRPTLIELDLIDVPMAGPVQTIIRTPGEDKKDINRAAKALNMDQSAFSRLAVVGVARKVLAEVAAKSQNTFQAKEGGEAESETGGSIPSGS